jgi:hypothetical protein
VSCSLVIRSGAAGYALHRDREGLRRWIST